MTGFLDDTLRDLRYALRGFARTPIVPATVVTTVALGLGLVTVAFTFLNAFLFSVDRVPDVHEMVSLVQLRSGDEEPAAFTRSDLEALRRETSVFVDAYAEFSGIDVRVDGRLFGVTATTGNFFQIARARPVLGRTLMPSDDERGAARPVAVLSDRGWERLFARDPHVLGRTVLVNETAFEVVGVMPDGFRGLSVIPPDYWVPLSAIGYMRPADRGREAGVGVRIVGRLKPGMSRPPALAALTVWAAGHFRGRTAGRPPAIDLVPWQGTVPQPAEAVIITGPLFFAFGLILLIACANVTNLLLARGVIRQREIGTRLSLGASRGRLVRQLMTESLLLGLMAAALGLVISRAALRLMIDAMMKSWPPQIGDLQLMIPPIDWRVLLFLVFGAIVSATFFGAVPALQATRTEPLRTIRGEVMGDARPGRARNALIALQVSASALLLICAAVFLRSALAAATSDPGMPPENTLTIGIPKEQVRASIVQAVTAAPLVAQVAASWPGGIAPPYPAVAESAGARASAALRFVSPEYFQVLDIAVIRGRPFAVNERGSHLGVVVVSESMATLLWPNGDPLGQIVRVDPEVRDQTPGRIGPALESRSATVVGVVRDVPGFRFAPFPKPVVYLPGNSDMAGAVLTARVHGDPGRARDVILQRLTAIDPAADQVETIGWIAKLERYFLQLGFWSTMCLGGLALVLTLSGLFSVLSYLVEQRTREIGVRMALGATTRDVMSLVVSQSIRPVGLGLIAGGGTAAALSALLLATPAAVFGQLVRVLDPVAYGGSLLLIMGACLAAASIPASRAARLDPARTLRRDS